MKLMKNLTIGMLFIGMTALVGCKKEDMSKYATKDDLDNYATEENVSNIPYGAKEGSILKTV